MKQKIVVKFGGSNFKTSSDISNLVDVVKRYNRPLVIVVSAFYGITDRLEDHLDKAAQGRCDIGAFTDFLTHLKKEVIYKNINNPEIRAEAVNTVKDRMNELSRLLKGVNLIGAAPDFVNDIVLSYGERLSSLILTAVLKFHKIECEEIFPEEIGLITDGEYGNATVDFKLSESKVSEKLMADKTFVIPGFYGVSPEGKVNLFGRGGSDYSAASIASCIQAESLDFWKDVDGFQSGDPRLVEKPKSISHLSYDEAAELAYFGAKILHPRTMEPLISNNIPVRIFNIYNYKDTDTPVTVINSRHRKSKNIVKSVASSCDFGILKLIGPGLGIKKGILARITSALDNSGINIKFVITSQTAINLLLAVNDLQRAHALIEKLHISSISELKLMDDVATAAVVGYGMTEEYGIAAKVFTALADVGINIEMISLGASPVASYFIVKNCDNDKAIKVVHASFFH